MNLLKKKHSMLEYNLRINNINGILQSLSTNLVVPFASIYAKRLNANDNDIAMINSYPAIFCLMAVFLGTFLFRNFKSKKSLTALFFGLSRSFFLIFIIVPFLPIWLQPGIFVLLYGMMNFPNSIATMGWQSFLGDLFEGEWRGRAFSKRSSLSNIAALIVTFSTGIMLYYIPHNNNERIQLYQVFFFIAFIVAIFEVFSFTKHKLSRNNKQLEIINENQKLTLKENLKNTYSILSSNKIFLDFCFCIVLFHFSWQMGWPVLFSYEYDVLHSNEFWTSLESTVSFISQAFAYMLWQRVAEKKGNSFTMFAAALTLSFCPFLYLLANNMIYIVIFTVITGSAAAGTILLLSNNLYETSSDKDRTIYIAFYTIITNITLMIAPIVGMKLKSIFNIYISLFIIGVLRFLSSLTFYRRYRKYKKLINN